MTASPPRIGTKDERPPRLAATISSLASWKPVRMRKRKRQMRGERGEEELKAVRRRRVESSAEKEA